MNNYFKCPKCRQGMTLPICSCGYTVPYNDSIYQLTDDPYIVKDDAADIKYIGYEEIGEYYSGKSLYQEIDIDDKYKKLTELIGQGVVLDLACGDGVYTVPLAALGVHLIAIDISDKMLFLLKKRAGILNVDLSNVTICRGNALDIPLCDSSINIVIANSVLHLISKPQIVINEIYRVLKTGGKFIAFNDRPGTAKINEKTLTQSELTENKRFAELSDFVHNEYWQRMKLLNIHGKRYSWQFNRDELCNQLFSRKEVYFIPNGIRVHNIFKDTFLPRMCGKGFSDQSDVPQKVHEKVFASVMNDFMHKYGEDALETAYTGFEDDEEIVLYIK